MIRASEAGTQHHYKIHSKDTKIHKQRPSKKKDDDEKIPLIKSHTNKILKETTIMRPYPANKKTRTNGNPHDHLPVTTIPSKQKIF